MNGMDIIRWMAPYLWPQAAPKIRFRVALSLLLLLLSKLVALGAPQLYGRAVDALSQRDVPDLMLGAVGLTVAYGLARVGSSGFQQLRDVVFAPVAQRAFRAVARETFEHLHGLSLRYHISRKTGGLSLVIERGVKAVEFLLRFLLFQSFHWSWNCWELRLFFCSLIFGMLQYWWSPLPVISGLRLG